MAKQTASQWLAEKLIYAEPNILEWQKYINQAKEMEKEDIQRAYYEGYYDANNNLPKDDEYYKENYED